MKTESSDAMSDDKLSYGKKALALVVIVLLVWLATDAFRPKRYKVGMNLEEVMRLAGGKQISLQDSSLETDGLSSPALDAEVAHSFYDSEEGLLVEFNHRKVVVSVRRWKYLGIDFIALINLFKKQRHVDG